MMTEAEWQVFVAELPPHVRLVAEQYPMTTCYRSTENPAWHFRIHSYDASRRGPTIPVTVTLVHGRDSTMPGVATFGQPPEQLIPCGCGNWQPPTRQQIRATGREIEKAKRQRARQQH